MGQETEVGMKLGLGFGWGWEDGCGWKGIENGVKGKVRVGVETWLCSKMETGTQPSDAGRARPPELYSFPAEQASAWEEDRKFVLRGWCLVFNILATLMLFGMLDGRMAYLQGSYTATWASGPTAGSTSAPAWAKSPVSRSLGRLWDALGAGWSLEMIRGENLWRNLFGCSWLWGGDF